MRRIEAVIKYHGHLSIYLLYTYYFSYNSQIKCFRTHVELGDFSSFGIWNSCPHFFRTFQLQPLYTTSIVRSMYEHIVTYKGLV
jgi:hypothetical protein